MTYGFVCVYRDNTVNVCVSVWVYTYHLACEDASCFMTCMHIHICRCIPQTEEIGLKIISIAKTSNKFSWESPYISNTFSRESPPFHTSFSPVKTESTSLKRSNKKIIRSESRDPNIWSVTRISSVSGKNTHDMHASHVTYLCMHTYIYAYKHTLTCKLYVY